MSDLRLHRTKADKNAARLLIFSRQWNNQKFLFLTLTFTKDVGDPVRKLEFLLRHLRKKERIEYFAIRTTEGNGAVFHLALVSKYIHHTEIRKRWKALTGAWNINIQYERDLKGFVSELTGQYGAARYSYSQDFVPKGTVSHLNWIKNNTCFQNRFKGYRMFCVRLKKHGNPLKAREETVTCLERIIGRCSSIYTEKEECFRKFGFPKGISLPSYY
jgi:hypothetical protein